MSAEPFSEEWWAEEAFQGAEGALPAERRAARAICEAYGILGVCDPAYIGNVLAARYAPTGPNPIEPGLDSACRFLISIYPALDRVLEAELRAVIVTAFERVRP